MVWLVVGSFFDIGMWQCTASPLGAYLRLPTIEFTYIDAIELFSNYNVLFSVVSASTNLVGKFTQSVRRIVQDVKDEGASSKLCYSL